MGERARQQISLSLSLSSLSGLSCLPVGSENHSGDCLSALSISPPKSEKGKITFSVRTNVHITPQQLGSPCFTKIKWLSWKRQRGGREISSPPSEFLFLGLYYITKGRARVALPPQSSTSLSPGRGKNFRNPAWLYVVNFPPSDCVLQLLCREACGSERRACEKVPRFFRKGLLGQDTKAIS